MYLKFRYFVFLFVLIICIPIKSFAQKEKIGRTIDSNIENNSVITDTTSISDSAAVNKKSDNFIDTKVIYNATDSIVLSSDSKKVFLLRPIERENLRIPEEYNQKVLTWEEHYTLLEYVASHYRKELLRFLREDFEPRNFESWAIFPDAV